MISIRLQERYTGSPGEDGAEQEDREEEEEGEEEGSGFASDDNKCSDKSEADVNKEADKEESQDENSFQMATVHSDKVRQVMRCLETEYGNEKPRWSAMNSPRSNMSPRPLEELKNLNAPNINGGSDYECTHCNISFGDCIMYTMHMGYHGFSDPFKCNMCGHVAKDKVAFFLHIARAAHE
jgi:hypothetical protein